MLMQFTQTSARIHTLSFPFLHLLSTQSLASRRHKMIPTPITVFILFLLFESIKNGVTSWFTIAVFRGELPVLSVSHLLSHLLFLFFLPKLLWRRKINRLSTKLSFFFPKVFFEFTSQALYRHDRNICDGTMLWVVLKQTNMDKGLIKFCIVST